MYEENRCKAGNIQLMQEIIAYKHTNDCVERSVYFMTKSNKLRSYNVTDFLARKHLLHDVALINLQCFRKQNKFVTLTWIQ